MTDKFALQESYVGTTRKGVIILADISGYTGLLTSADLAKAAGIVNHITERLFNATQEQFIVNEIEGDALYLYCLETPEVQGEELFITALLQLEAYADAFYHAWEELKYSNLKDDPETSKLIDNISLKFVAHYGSFTFNKIGPFVKLVGADCILAHRLLKNQVESDSYFLFTSSFLKLDHDQEHAKAVAHIEEIKHFGNVEVGVRVFDYNEEHARRHGDDHKDLTKPDVII